MDVPQWIWGVILSFVGCAMSNLGVNMQKLAHTRAAALGEPDAFTKYPMWLGGMSMVIVGSVMDLLSFGFAPMSLLAPLGAMTLVLNMCIAPCFLNEQLTRKDVLFTLVIVAGTIVCITFGSKDESTYTIQQLISLYSDPTFIVFAVVFCIVVLVVYFLLRQISIREKKKLQTVWDVRFQAFAYPCMAGTFGAMSVLFAKSCTEIAKMTINGDNQFKNFFAYIEIALLLLCVFLQMKLLNMGLEKADALFVVPIYQVFWVVMNVVAGMIYFQDYESMTWTAMFCFIIGVIITLLGVHFLTQRGSAKKVSADTSSLPHNNLSTLSAKERFANRRRASSFLLGLRASVRESLDDTPEETADELIAEAAFRPLSGSTTEIAPNVQEENVGMITGL